MVEAKRTVEVFLCSEAPTMNVNFSNVPWYLEWLRNYTAYNRGTIGFTVFEHLYTQLDFAQNY